MELPKSLSATSVEVLESCFARWVSEYLVRAAQPDRHSAGLGSACHYGLQMFVEGGYHLDHANNYGVLIELYTQEYERLFSDRSKYDEGVVMLHNWWQRQDWTGRTVLSAERKDNFTIKVKGTTPAGNDYEAAIPFNYIWDRCDQLEDPKGLTVIEIVDYKSNVMPLAAAGLADKIQARCYGLAAQVAYPKADRIWVTFDMLRHDPVGVVFTREQNIATYRYLQRVLRRIVEAGEGVDPPETLNSMCHWCIRKQVCETLTRHVDADGILGITDPIEMASRRYLLECQRKGVDAAMGELDKSLLTHMESESILEFETDVLKVSATMSSRRTLDSERAMRVVKPELIAEYGSLGVTAVDRLLKDPRLTEDERKALRGMIRNTTGEPKIKIIPKNPID